MLDLVQCNRRKLKALQGSDQNYYGTVSAGERYFSQLKTRQRGATVVMRFRYMCANNKSVHRPVLARTPFRTLLVRGGNFGRSKVIIRPQFSISRRGDQHLGDRHAPLNLH